ncbi:DNA cytosine methyltransferase [Oleiharenicola lentus]|uniref:DNA cytosine methyltransferase n=1 Tax=Oleiharenicola lentus TaxID=2508720 RepID=UPI003F6674B6
MVRKPKILGIDLFAGAGGLSLGAQLAGVDVTHAIENHPAAAETYRINHPQTRLIDKDIRLVAPVNKKTGSLSILFGGPPCQGFSTSNQRTRSTSNPRNWLFGEFFRFARFGKPDWIVLENVKGLRETAQGQFEDMILDEFHNLGYSSAVWSLCAADYGVPQKRHRLFFIGRRRGNLPSLPKRGVTHPVTVRQAIADLPRLAVGADVDELRYRISASHAYAKKMRGTRASCTGHLVTTNNDLVLERYRHIPPGGNWTDIPKRLMKNYTNLVDDRSRHTGIYRRLKWDEPSVVIGNYRKNMLIHPEQDRGLSVREAARLQSFPDRYAFLGSIGFQQQQVGNAVPPLLAEAVFRAIIDAC